MNYRLVNETASRGTHKLVLYVTPRWPDPGQEPTAEDFLRRVLVPMQREAAMRTFMPPIEERLGDDLSASATALAGPSRIHLHVGDAGALSLASQRQQEAVPTGIADRTGIPAAPDHPQDVQAFGSDKPETTDQLQRDVVVMLLPEVPHPRVNLPQSLDRLAAVLASQFLAGDGAALAPQLRQGVLEVSRIRLSLALRGSQERIEPHVDAGRVFAGGDDRHIRQYAREDDIPLVGLSLEGNGLDRPLDFAVEDDFDLFPDGLDSKPSPGQPDPVAVGGELETVEPISALESGEAGLAVLRFGSPEERLVRLVQTAHRRLGAAEVDVRVEGVRLPGSGEIRRLIGVFHRPFFRLVDRLPLVQAGVVETSVRLAHRLQVALLVGIRVEAELEGSAHGLSPLLVGDIAFDRCGTDVPHRSGVVRSAPEGRQSRPQRGELFAKHAGGVSLEPVQDLGHASCGIGFHEEVDVVGHDLHRLNRHAQLGGFLRKQISETVRHGIDQDGTPELGAPHDVVLQGVDGARVLPITFFHAQIIRSAAGKARCCQKIILTSSRRRRFPRRLKATVPSPDSYGHNSARDRQL